MGGRFLFRIFGKSGERKGHSNRRLLVKCLRGKIEQGVDPPREKTGAREVIQKDKKGAERDGNLMTRLEDVPIPRSWKR